MPTRRALIIHSKTQFSLQRPSALLIFDNSNHMGDLVDHPANFRRVFQGPAVPNPPQPQSSQSRTLIFRPANGAAGLLHCNGFRTALSHVSIDPFVPSLLSQLA